MTISLRLMQQSYVTHHLHLKRYIQHLQAVHIQLECTRRWGSLWSCICGLMRQFLGACGLALSPRQAPFMLLGLQSSQIKFLMMLLSVRKHISYTLYKLSQC